MDRIPENLIRSEGYFSTRTFFGDLKDGNGIRSHNSITAFFLRLFFGDSGPNSKITAVNTSNGVIYLNKNSLNKWLEFHSAYHKQRSGVSIEKVISDVCNISGNLLNRSEQSNLELKEKEPPVIPSNSSNSEQEKKKYSVISSNSSNLEQEKKGPLVISSNSSSGKLPESRSTVAAEIDQALPNMPKDLVEIVVGYALPPEQTALEQWIKMSEDGFNATSRCLSTMQKEGIKKENQKIRVALAKTAANNDASELSKNIYNFKITKEEDRIAIAKIAAAKAPIDLFKFIKLYNIQNPEELIKILIIIIAKEKEAVILKSKIVESPSEKESKESNENTTRKMTVEKLYSLLESLLEDSQRPPFREQALLDRIFAQGSIDNLIHSLQTPGSDLFLMGKAPE